MLSLAPPLRLLLLAVGHNLQRPSWTWSAATEVTVNLFTLWSMQAVLGRGVAEALGNWQSVPAADMDARLVRHGGGADAGAVAGGDVSYSKWRSDPAHALSVFAAFIRRFGFPALAAAIALIDGRAPGACAAGAAGGAGAHVAPAPLPRLTYSKGRSGLPETEQRAVDAWALGGSAATGVNLVGFFSSWGLPVSEEAARAVAHLPAA